MRERYETCESYEDTGTVVDVHVESDGSRHVARSLTFGTAFERASGAFAFQYSSTDGQRAWIWRRPGRSARVWTSFGGEQDAVDVGLAIAALTGVSLTAAYEVPTRLLRLSNITDAGRFYPDGDEPVGSVQSLRVVRGDGGVLLWIGKGDEMLRRIRLRSWQYPRDLLADPRIAPMFNLDDRARIEATRLYFSEVTIEYHPRCGCKIDWAQWAPTEASRR
jgi:hypothetical protein